MVLNNEKDVLVKKKFILQFANDLKEKKMTLGLQKYFHRDEIFVFIIKAIRELIF